MTRVPVPLIDADLQLKPLASALIEQPPIPPEFSVRTLRNQSFGSTTHNGASAFLRLGRS